MTGTFYNLNLIGETDKTIDFMENFKYDDEVVVTVILESSKGEKVVLLPGDNQLEFGQIEL